MAKDPLEPERCARFMAALAAPERLKIVRFLTDGPQHVAAIAEMLAIPAVNASHHLAVLKKAGLISGTKSGRYVYYALLRGVLETDPAGGPPRQALNFGCCKLELPPPGVVRPDSQSRTR